MKCERCGEVNPAEIHTCSPQEPVAWMTNHDEPLLFPTKNEASQYCNEDEEPQPLYTSPPKEPLWIRNKEGKLELHAPPQREWQGLTDEEQLEIMKQFGPGQRRLFADAIEAKLKEKNS